MASKRRAMYTQTTGATRNWYNFGVASERVTREELETKRVAARTCGCVCVTIDVIAAPHGIEERRHYIARSNEVGGQKEPFTGTEDPQWFQLPATVVKEAVLAGQSAGTAGRTGGSPGEGAHNA